MTNWAESRRIESPEDLATLIEDVSQAVRDGKLKQINPNRSSFITLEDILQISPKGPWPDYLEYYFEDTKTGEQYKLIAETYHGSGGNWEKI
jgi:hypothetical protein